MQLFGGYFGDGASAPRSNFDSFHPSEMGIGAFMTIFQVSPYPHSSVCTWCPGTARASRQVLTTENWNNIMYSGINAYEPKIVPAVYFLLLFTIGVYLIMNLFLAILLQNFGDSTDQNEAEQGKADGTVAIRLRSAFAALTHRLFSTRIFQNPDSLFLFSPKHPLRRFCAKICRNKAFDQMIVVCIAMSSVILAMQSPLDEPASIKYIVLDKFDLLFVIVFALEMLLKIITHGLILGGPHERAYLADGWNLLDCAVVVISLITAFGESHLKSLRTLRALRAMRPLRFINRNPGMKLVVNCLIKSIPSMFNVVLVCVLFFSIFAIWAMQLFKGQNYFCSQPTNASWPALLRSLDAAIPPSTVLATLVNYGTTSPGTTFASTFTEIAGPNAMSGTTAWYPFDKQSAIFSRSFNRECNSTHPCQIVNWLTCYEAGGIWLKYEDSFDTVFESLQTLFVVSTLEGWVDIMNHAMDTTSPGLVHSKLEAPLTGALFFLLFVLVCNFFVLNLFVGVVIDNYAILKTKEDTATYGYNAREKSWIRTTEHILFTKPRKRLKCPNSKFQFFFNLVTDLKFESFVMACIVVNVVYLATPSFDSPPWMENFLEGANYVLTAIFTLEAVLKIVGLGYLQYFKDKWNVFDICIVLLSLVGIGLNQEGSGSGDGTSGTGFGVVRAFRALRITRLIRIIKSAAALKRQLQVLVLSAPSLLNVGGLLVLVWFIYAVLGVQFFWNVQPRSDYLNQHANFENFGNAIFLLIRMTTGENWHRVMWECQLGICKGYQGACQENDCSLGCGGPRSSLLYFHSFIIICPFVMLNLFIAVILDNDKEARDQENNALHDQLLESFRMAWSFYDPEAVGYAYTLDLLGMLQRLRPPLGPGPLARSAAVKRFVRRLDVRDYGGLISYIEVFHAFAYQVAGTSLPENDSTQTRVRARIRKYASRLCGVPKVDADFLESIPKVYETLAALELQCFYRKHIQPLLRIRAYEKAEAFARSEASRHPVTVAFAVPTSFQLELLNISGRASISTCTASHTLLAVSPEDDTADSLHDGSVDKEPLGAFRSLGATVTKLLLS
jgi:hypothetical protein